MSKEHIYGENQPIKFPEEPVFAQTYGMFGIDTVDSPPFVNHAKYCVPTPTGNWEHRGLIVKTIYNPSQWGWIADSYRAEIGNPRTYKAAYYVIYKNSANAQNPRHVLSTSIMEGAVLAHSNKAHILMLDGHVNVWGKSDFSNNIGTWIGPNGKWRWINIPYYYY